MRRVTISEAKRRLPQIVDAVERGEDVVVVRSGRPVVRLVPFAPSDTTRMPARRECFGVDTSGWRVPDDFDDPLPDDVVDAFS